jgi:hypothetical protein
VFYVQAMNLDLKSIFLFYKKFDYLQEAFSLLVNQIDIFKLTDTASLTKHFSQTTSF